MTRQRAALALIALVSLAVAREAHAGQIVSLTFDELATDTPLAPSVTVAGVTFTYLDGPFAVYNSVNAFEPGVDAMNLEGSAMEGDTQGSLQIDFAAAALDLEFALALSTSETLNPGFSVELFGPGLSSLGVFDIITTSLVPGTGFSEGLFSIRGTVIRRALITFSESVSSSVFTFAVDNLRATVVPEPGSMALFLSGGLGLAALARRGREARRTA